VRHATLERIVNTYVALLYSIILGEGRRVVMSDLRRMAEDLGLHAPRTLVATGNLVFETEIASVPELEALLETAFEKTFGRHVDIIVRGAPDWRLLPAGNPVPGEAETDGSRVIVRVGRKPLDDGAAASLQPYLTDGERVRIVSGDLWVYFGGQPSQSRLPGALTPKRLGGVGTLRNWNTVRRLGEIVGG